MHNEGRRKREEGRGKREEGRRKREESKGYKKIRIDRFGKGQLTTF
ncbi:MAG: hypothetical protein HC849_27220 [Oscillatoriales cyanobacterium RU_3_3]|nr:hypothetical protein [Oscillatoriales cyanobacterium RU_3_3]NJR25113.1 hypothetical protein [Richelia sp. CSU_2_1]